MDAERITTTQRKTNPGLRKDRILQLFRIPATVGRIKTLALLDTGSQASILSAYFLSQIPESELRNENTEQSTFRSACGMPMETIGTFEIDITLHQKDKGKIRQIFHAIPNLTEACILGIDFITNNRIKIDSLTREIAYTNNDNEYSIIGKIEKLETGRTTPVLTKKPSIIPRIDNDDARYKMIVEQLIESNKDIIAEKTAELGKAIGIKHKINTGTAAPIFTPLRRAARATQHIIKQNVEEMLLYNIVRPSTSPYSSPVVLA